MMHKNNKKGFTLAELLIVVAIIAVLVAIAIPVFTSQLEKSREATDISNIRAYYAEITTSLLTGDMKKSGDKIYVGNNIPAVLKDNLPTSAGNTFTVELTPVAFQQTVADWQTAAFDIAGAKLVKNAAGTATDASSAINAWASGNNKITYQFTLAIDGDYYLSKIILDTASA